MKKLLLFLAVISLCGCASFGRGIAEAILDNPEKTDNKKCEISGSEFAGIELAFQNKETVKILMIHGVGTHVPGYSTRIRENLAAKLGLNTMSRRPKNITLLDPSNPKQEIGNLRVTRMQDEDDDKEFIFYELTWSATTLEAKKILDFDKSGDYKYRRAAFNNTMKGFLDDVIPDPMIYLMDPNKYILNATKQSTCWMLGKSWDEIKDGEKQVCNVSSHQEMQNLKKENIIFITHSLGSKIMIDTLTNIVDMVSAADKNSSQASQLIIDELKTKKLTVFMLANQLPLLQITQPKPKVSGKIPQYCTPNGSYYGKRVFDKVNIIAFSDPNDLLSYDIPQQFVDEYIDSRICPEVTNVSINVADIISAFGVGVVNPVTAHTGYDNDNRVIEIIANGTRDYKNNSTLSEQCRFVKIKD